VLPFLFLNIVLGGDRNRGVGIMQSEAHSREDQALSERIVNARLEATVLNEFPGQLPTDLQQAYSVQAASIAQWPDEVAGWKVARLPPGDRDRFAQERLAGPVYRSTVETAEPGTEIVAHIYDGGFAAIEAEVVLELGEDVPRDFDTSNDSDLAGLVAKAYCGAEIASSPMPFVIDLGAMSIISDMGINAGVIVGPEIADFMSLPDDALSVGVTVNGEVVGQADPGPVSGSPFDALRFLIDHCNAQDIRLSRGSLVSTGMITGVHDVTVGCKARVDYGKFGWFDVAFEPIGRK
jgi:2-keto-4-pentenoate hydratase